jgi:hypothetical protein
MSEPASQPIGTEPSRLRVALATAHYNVAVLLRALDEARDALAGAGDRLTMLQAAILMAMRQDELGPECIALLFLLQEGGGQVILRARGAAGRLASPFGRSAAGAILDLWEMEYRILTAARIPRIWEAVRGHLPPRGDGAYPAGRERYLPGALRAVLGGPPTAARLLALRGGPLRAPGKTVVATATRRQAAELSLGLMGEQAIGVVAMGNELRTLLGGFDMRHWEAEANWEFVAAQDLADAYSRAGGDGMPTMLVGQTPRGPAEDSYDPRLLEAIRAKYKELGRFCGVNRLYKKVGGDRNNTLRHIRHLEAVEGLTIGQRKRRPSR